jgi:hypothetical protein
VLGSVADAFQDRPEQMARPVAQGEARDEPAGQRIGVRRAVALEVVEHDQPLGTDRDVPCQLVQDHVGIHPAALRLGDRAAGEVVLEQATTEPVDAWPASTVYCPRIMASV